MGGDGEEEDEDVLLAMMRERMLGAGKVDGGGRREKGVERGRREKGGPLTQKAGLVMTSATEKMDDFFRDEQQFRVLL